jgi:hypothetical protein
MLRAKKLVVGGLHAGENIVVNILISNHSTQGGSS